MYFRKLLLASILAGSAVFPAMADDHMEPVTVFNVLPLKESQYATFLPVMQKNAKATREEDGNISFEVLAPEEGDGTLYLFEEWMGKTALDNHTDMPHLKAVGEKVGAALKDGKSENSFMLNRLSEPGDEDSTATADIHIITTLQSKPEHTDHVKAVLAAMVEPGRGTEGNVRFDIYEFKDTPEKLMIYEQWQSTDAYQQSMQLPYSGTLSEIAPKMLSGPADKNRLVLKDVSQ